jgi:FtsH-binding integral membrane protein
MFEQSMQYSYATMERLVGFMYKVYAYMAGALVLTAITAYSISQSPSATTFLFSHPYVILGILVIQIALVFVINFFISHLSFPVMLILFMGYALLLGITLSSLFLIYHINSIYVTFAVTAILFAAMALYGYYTQSDLTTLGRLAGFALFGLIIALLVNLFFQNSLFDLVISGIGVLVFICLIAFDSQKIKNIGANLISHQQEENKIALLCALILYLDVINLFLFLLRFLGKRRN